MTKKEKDDEDEGSYIMVMIAGAATILALRELYINEFNLIWFLIIMFSSIFLSIVFGQKWLNPKKEVDKE